ncbi:MAG TPA: histidine phosphatase family protein [Pirellulales bacterium]|jgi:phosphohistidine phosphatase|nr:histidine phosphatase family protein [Pirellulales bacterium]
MLLYIVRHAPAGQHGDPRYPNDSLRPLTRKGQRRFGSLVRRLVRHGLAPSLVVTSPLLRCRQTAEILVARAHEPPKLLERDELAPGAHWADLIDWTSSEGAEEVAWVGHAPDVDRMTAELIGSTDANLSFAKGAIAAIRFPAKIAIGEGELNWLVKPKLIG